MRVPVVVWQPCELLYTCYLLTLQWLLWQINMTVMNMILYGDESVFESERCQNPTILGKSEIRRVYRLIYVEWGFTVRCIKVSFIIHCCLSVFEKTCTTTQKKRKVMFFLKFEKKRRLTAYVQFHRPLNHSAFNTQLPKRKLSTCTGKSPTSQTLLRNADTISLHAAYM